MKISGIKHLVDNDIPIICICEGNSEISIMKILIENNKLIFDERNLLSGDFFGNYYRNGSRYEDIKSRHMQMYGMDKVGIVLIQDNETKYHVKNKYKKEIESVLSVITPPEIEILHIHALGLYNEYQRFERRNKGSSKKVKPSIFLSEHLKKRESILKSEAFIRDLYSEHSLENAIEVYIRKVSKKCIKGSYTLKDLLVI